jgi:hypothetical protein
MDFLIPLFSAIFDKTALIKKNEERIEWVW